MLDGIEVEVSQFRDMCLKFSRDHIEPHVFDWEEAHEFPRDPPYSSGNPAPRMPASPALR